MKDLSEDSVLSQVKNFVRDFGMKPKYLLADRDFKLIGDSVEKFLSPDTKTAFQKPTGATFVTLCATI